MAIGGGVKSARW